MSAARPHLTSIEVALITWVLDDGLICCFVISHRHLVRKSKALDGPPGGGFGSKQYPDLRHGGLGEVRAVSPHTQECQQRAVDLFRRVVLDPMTCVCNALNAQVRHPRLQAFGQRQTQIAVALAPQE